jgi:hypothetical protein
MEKRRSLAKAAVSLNLELRLAVRRLHPPLARLSDGLPPESPP